MKRVDSVDISIIIIVVGGIGEGQFYEYRGYKVLIDTFAY